MARRGPKVGQRTLAWQSTGYATCRGCGEEKNTFRKREPRPGFFTPYAYCGECEAEKNKLRYITRQRPSPAQPEPLQPPATLEPPSPLSDGLRAAKVTAPNAARAEAALIWGVPEGQLKQCSGCAKWKVGSTAYFEPRPRNSTGLTRDCRTCRERHNPDIS